MICRQDSLTTAFPVENHRVPEFTVSSDMRTSQIKTFSQAGHLSRFLHWEACISCIISKVASFGKRIEQCQKKQKQSLKSSERKGEGLLAEIEALQRKVQHETDQHHILEMVSRGQHCPCSRYWMKSHEFCCIYALHYIYGGKMPAFHIPSQHFEYCTTGEEHTRTRACLNYH